jgi:hypothetical protein
MWLWRACGSDTVLNCCMERHCERSRCDVLTVCDLTALDELAIDWNSVDAHNFVAVE